MSVKEYRVRPCHLRALALVLLSPLASPAFASPLFDDDAVIEIGLSGPLRTLARDKKRADPVELPFVLSIDGADIPVDVRVRGKSRTIACGFPPLRLRFRDEAASETVFSGQKKLKLVTHCKSNSNDSEDNLLEEYTAYRIFNLISDTGYRVRLLRIHYEDTDESLKHLERPYYGFLIESDKELAARTGGKVSKISGIPYSRLNLNQTALVYVFQYLIGNTDWSLVKADGADRCCHNVRLVQKGDGLYPIPYDFDLSGLVDASYAKADSSVGLKRVTQRKYRGYCKSPIESVALALEKISSLRDSIMALVEDSPIVFDEDTESRARYIGHFFEETENTERLLTQFNGDCVGPR